MNIGYEAKRIFHNKTGLGNYSRDLVKMLSYYYPDNHYFLYNPKSSTLPLFSPENTKVVEKLPQTSFDKKFYNLWRQKRIIKDLKNDQITLFHGLSGELPMGLKKNNIKSVVTIHDLIFLRYPKYYSFWDRQIHYLKFKKAVQQADKVIAISEQTKKDIVYFLKIDPSKIEVVYQSCMDVFKKEYTDKEKREVLDLYQLPEKYLLSVGTIEERKNLLNTVKAIHKTNQKLVVIGKKTTYFKHVNKYITSHRIEKNIIFLENINPKDLAIIYHCASIFIYPSLFEGFGIPIIESLFSKTPVITSNLGCFPEAGGPSSIYINPKKPSEIANAIEMLLHNENVKNEIIESGYQFVQKFNTKDIAANLINVYKNVLK